MSADVDVDKVRARTSRTIEGQTLYPTREGMKLMTKHFPEPPGVSGWLTYVEGRAVEFQRHRSLYHAQRELKRYYVESKGFKSLCAIYEAFGGVWVGECLVEAGQIEVPWQPHSDVLGVDESKF